MKNKPPFPAVFGISLICLLTAAAGPLSAQQEAGLYGELEINTETGDEKQIKLAVSDLWGSGDYILEAWATENKYEPAGSAPFPEIGDDPGASYLLGAAGVTAPAENVEEYTDYTHPPSGTYWFTLLLRQNGEIAAYFTFETQRDMTIETPPALSGEVQATLSEEEGIMMARVVADVTYLIADMRLELWATGSPYDGSGDITGHQLISIEVENYSTDDHLPYRYPDPGTYYISLLLYGGDEQLDYQSLPNPEEFPAIPEDPLAIAGNASWSYSGAESIHIHVAGVSNSNDIESTSCRIRVAASRRLYQGEPTITGYTLAEYEVGKVAAYSTAGVDTTVNAGPVPAGSYYTYILLEQYIPSEAGFRIVDFRQGQDIGDGIPELDGEGWIWSSVHGGVFIVPLEGSVLFWSGDHEFKGWLWTRKDIYPWIYCWYAAGDPVPSEWLWLFLNNATADGRWYYGFGRGDYFWVSHP